MTPDTAKKLRREPGDKPFPWRCPRCLVADAVHLETICYAAEIGHEGQVYRLQIPDFKVPRCRSCQELIFSHEADEQIREAFRSHLRLLTAEHIRLGRAELALSQEKLANRLGIAQDTLARWEAGDSIRPRAMDALLRSCFNSPVPANATDA